MSFLDCRNKVVDELNASFTGFTAEPVLNPSLDQQEAINLRVLVAPFQQVLTRVTRAKTEAIYTIQIAVIRKVNKTTTDESVLTTSTAIMEHFFNKNLPVNQDPPDYASMEVSSVPFYDYEYLDQDNLVVSIIQVNYKENI